MRDYKTKTKLFGYLFTMFFLISPFSQSLEGGESLSIDNSKEKKSEKGYDINILSALIDFEKETHGKNDKANNDDTEEPFRGTFYLIGDFDKSKPAEVEEIVISDLDEIGYKKISKQCANSNLVTIMSKRKSELNDGFFIKDNSNEKSFNSFMEKHSLSRKIIERLKICDKVKNGSSEPLVIQHFENKKQGIKTMFIAFPKELDLPVAVGEKQLINHPTYKPNPLKGFFPRLTQLGPKVFLDSGH